MKIQDMYHRRDSDFESFDRIELIVTPRYKTSGLSGDEWRTSVRVLYWFKGRIVVENSYNNMQCALMALPKDWVTSQEPIPDEVIKLEEKLCDQPGCAGLATVFYRVKTLFSKSGDRLDPTDQHLEYYRKFCDSHRKRGDCSREDCDDNYELIER